MALGNPTLVNHKTYHYMSIAYGFNPAEINANPYDVNNPLYDGRNQPHIGWKKKYSDHTLQFLIRLTLRMEEQF